MPGETHPQTETAQAAFAMLIALLSDVVVSEGHRLRIGMPLTILIWQRVCRLAARFAWLVAHGPATLRTRRRSKRKPKPKPTPLPEEAELPNLSSTPAIPKRKPLKLRRDFNWLRRMLPSDQIAAVRSQLDYLLAQPYMVDLIEANQTIGLVIRPLCRMLGAPIPNYLRPILADPAPSDPEIRHPPRLPSHPATRAHDPEPANIAKAPLRENFAF